MVRSRNWPDLWWQISKIRDIQVVGIYDLMKRWRFETNRISSVATAQPQSQKPVFDFDLTWWPDLWWPGAEIFTQGVKFNCEQVLKKWRRCAPPFFRYPRKTGGVGIFCPPPPPVRVLSSVTDVLLTAMSVLQICHRQSDVSQGGHQEDIAVRAPNLLPAHAARDQNIDALQTWERESHDGPPAVAAARPVPGPAICRFVAFGRGARR